MAMSKPLVQTGLVEGMGTRGVRDGTGAERVPADRAQSLRVGVRIRRRPGRGSESDRLSTRARIGVCALHLAAHSQEGLGIIQERTAATRPATKPATNTPEPECRTRIQTRTAELVRQTSARALALGAMGRRDATSAGDGRRQRGIGGSGSTRGQVRLGRRD